MTEVPDSPPALQLAAVESRNRRAIVLRLLLICATALSLFVAAGVYISRLPSELEQEIHLDLLSHETIEESAHVTVLEKIRLHSFHFPRSYPTTYATICVQDGTEFQIGGVWLPREGISWRSDEAPWKTLDTWPTAEQIELQKQRRAFRIAESIEAGRLPRPPGRENFRVRHLTIQTSRTIVDFDPNAKIDPALFAELLEAEVQYTGQSRINRFVSAPFHEPRWTAAHDGVLAVDEYVDYLERYIKTARFKAVNLEPRIQTLRTCIEVLEKIETHGLDFYLLAHDARNP